MSARELEARARLREAESLLLSHRDWVRRRPQNDENRDEHERTTQALHRTREALAHLGPIVRASREDDTREVPR